MYYITNFNRYQVLCHRYRRFLAICPFVPEIFGNKILNLKKLHTILQRCKLREEEYIKESIIIDKSEEEKHKELIKSIIVTKELLLQAHNNFEYAEKDLIDYYTYNIKANQAKLNYLIKQAKNISGIEP